MTFTLAFSPCPNDTFIFDALVNNKIDTQGISFEVILEDVETLNRLALQNRYHFTKISYGALPLVLHDYVVLDSGSALGNGAGPLLVAKTFIPKQEIYNCVIAIPGINTTAHLLFSMAFPNAKNKVFLRYDEIEDFVLKKTSQAFRPVDGGNLSGSIFSEEKEKTAGVIIHESRFTYQKKGLKKIMDLGDFWQNKTGYPIPLGGIVAGRNLDSQVVKKIDDLIKKSIEYSFGNYPVITEYVRKHSQEMKTDVMKKHIDLYVNNFSLSLGDIGKKAIIKFLEVYRDVNNVTFSKEKIFL